MSHPQQREFLQSVKNNFSGYFNGKKVLEVGSLNINGSARDFFSNCDYVGIDVGPGNGVDIVCQGQDFDAPNETFDTIISCECFEHNPEWVATFTNMHRMCKTDGLIIMTCATVARLEHGTSRSDPDASPLTRNIGWEYYRNLSEKDFREHFDIESMFKKFQFSLGWFSGTEPMDLYFYGIKA